MIAIPNSNRESIGDPSLQEFPSMQVNEEKPQNWYFTFGFGHPNHNKYYVIFGTFDSARSEMFETFGNKWAFQYGESDWTLANGKTQAEEWNLTEL